jgi:hypothetical protein
VWVNTGGFFNKIGSIGTGLDLNVLKQRRSRRLGCSVKTKHDKDAKKRPNSSKSVNSDHRSCRRERRCPPGKALIIITIAGLSVQSVKMRVKSRCCDRNSDEKAY